MDLDDLQQRHEWAQDAKEAFEACVDALSEARSAYAGEGDFDTDESFTKPLAVVALDLSTLENSDDEIRAWEAEDLDLDDVRVAAQAAMRLALVFATILRGLQTKLENDGYAADHWDKTVRETLLEVIENGLEDEAAKAWAEEWTDGADLAMQLRRLIDEQVGDDDEGEKTEEAVRESVEAAYRIDLLTRDVEAASKAGGALLAAVDALRRAQKWMTREETVEWMPRILETLTLVVDANDRTQAEETAQRWELVPHLALKMRAQLDAYRAELGAQETESTCEERVLELVFGAKEY